MVKGQADADALHRLGKMVSGLTADRQVVEALCPQPGRIVHIASVDDHRRLERRADHLEIGGTEHLPLGDDQQGVGE